MRMEYASQMLERCGNVHCHHILATFRVE